MYLLHVYTLYSSLSEEKGAEQKGSLLQVVGPNGLLHILGILFQLQEEKDKVKKQAAVSREARSETRRIQNVLSSMGEDLGDLLKFNQLKVRMK